MGRIEVGSAIRYVSPVTARLFSKTGPEVLGLTGKVLVPVEEGPPAWRRQPPSEKAQHQKRQQMQRARRMNRPKAYGGAAQRSVEFVDSSPPSPTTDDVELTSPQMCFEAILRERVRYNSSTILSLVYSDTTVQYYFVCTTSFRVETLILRLPRSLVTL